MSFAEKWGDLPARIGSAVIMIGLGAICIWQGGMLFLGIVVLGCAACFWELAGMLGPDLKKGPKLLIAGLSGLGLGALGLMVISGFAAPILMISFVTIPVFVGAYYVNRDRAIFVSYGLAIMLACFTLYVLRDFRGMQWVIWLVLVVVVTDVAGYFVGRVVGGPKFWPRVSPKKTWSGTIGGWVGAAGVGLMMGGTDIRLAVVSVLVAFASQMGDIAESAIKRRCGVKDSSNLIPGHGGVLDRFDGMLAAVLMVLLIGASVGLPGGG